MAWLELAGWRERVAQIYVSELDLAGFRAARDELFRSHPQSPVRPGDFHGLAYFEPDDAAIVEARLEPATGELEIDTGGADGVLTYQRIGIAATPYGPLTLWWLDCYGGGLFLPFRDATAGAQTYGGGRYLTDTIKGTHGRGVAWLGEDRVRLDFNYAYNPSCAYDDRWACPLAPQENRLTTTVRAGEKMYRR